MPKRVYFILLFFLLGAIPASAAEATFDEEPLSLKQALRVAYVQNPQMIEARKEIAAAKGRWIQAEALPDPEMEIDIGGLKRQNKAGKSVRAGNFDTFAVKQPLDPPGVRFLRGRVGHNEVKIAEGELRNTWAEVRKNVIQFYSNILAGEKAQEIGTENLNATKQFYSRVETRFQSGNALRSDVLRAQIEVSRAENELLITEKDLKIARSQLNLTLGRAVEAPLNLKDSLTYEPLHYRYKNLKENIVEGRADVANEKLRLNSRKKDFLASILRTFFPKMGIGFQRNTQDFQNDTSLTLQASYPLWGFNLGEVKAARAEKQKQEVHLEAFKKQARLEVYQAFLEADLADKQVGLQKNALDEANELLRQVTLKYEEGEVPFLVYLENIKTIKETRAAYYLALKSYREKVADFEKAIQATPVPEGGSR